MPTKTMALATESLTKSNVCPHRLVLPLSRASSPSARSRTKESRKTALPMSCQGDAPAANIAAAAKPDANLSAVTWFGVTGVFARGRTRTRTPRCIQVSWLMSSLLE